jgi:hypothetical protein
LKLDYLLIAFDKDTAPKIVPTYQS